MSTLADQAVHPEPASQWVLGCGDVFEAVADDPEGYALAPGRIRWHRFESVAALAPEADGILARIPCEGVTLFVAVDAHALNYARLELYGRARLKGMKLCRLIHRTAVVSPSAELSDNVWVGPSAVIGRGCRIGSNTFVGACARLDADVEIGAHGWVGAGSSIGRGCRIAQHAVIGADARLKPDTQLGHHVALEQPGPWSGVIPAGTFVEHEVRARASLIGLGYTYRRQGSP